MTAYPHPPLTYSPEATFAISRKTVWLWLTLLVIVGIYLRVHIALHYAYGNDEAMHIAIASGNALADVLRFARYEVHPPLFYLPLHYWMKLSCAPEFTRMLPLLYGISLIPIYSLIGAKMAGRLSGLCCAVLVTFSYGCIMQSYVIRQYSIMLPFLSLHFYCYLCWRASPTRLSLAGGVIFGWLAALSEFSSFFYFACITAFEMISLLKRRAEWRHIIGWATANVFLAAGCLWIYHAWQPTAWFYTQHDGTLFFVYAPTLAGRIRDTLSAPLQAIFYIEPAFPVSITLLTLAIYALWPSHPSPARACITPYLLLAGTGCLLSMAIYILRLYPSLGTRHCIWMLPLLTPVTGGMLSQLLARLRAHSKKACVYTVVTTLLLVALSDNAKQRASEEYRIWQPTAWKAITSALAKLGPQDVIITDMNGSNLLINTYPYKSDSAFMNGTTPVLVPYRNTHILIGPEYFYNFSPKALRQLLQEAQRNHLFDQMQRLVFLKSWEKYPFYGIITCNGLPLNTLYPALPHGQKLSQETFPMYGLALVAVKKQTFMSDVLSDGGKAGSCLDARIAVLTDYYTPMSEKRFAP